MKKFILLLLTISLLSGCEFESRDNFKSYYKNKVQCIDGVQYYVFHAKYDYGMIPLFNPDSTIKTCNRNTNELD